MKTITLFFTGIIVSLLPLHAHSTHPEIEYEIQWQEKVYAVLTNHPIALSLKSKEFTELFLDPKIRRETRKDKLVLLLYQMGNEIMNAFEHRKQNQAITALNAIHDYSPSFSSMVKETLQEEVIQRKNYLRRLTLRNRLPISDPSYLNHLEREALKDDGRRFIRYFNDTLILLQHGYELTSEFKLRPVEDFHLKIAEILRRQVSILEKIRTEQKASEQMKKKQFIAENLIEIYINQRERVLFQASLSPSTENKVLSIFSSLDQTGVRLFFPRKTTRASLNGFQRLHRGLLGHCESEFYDKKGKKR